MVHQDVKTVCLRVAQTRPRGIVAMCCVTHRLGCWLGVQVGQGAFAGSVQEEYLLPCCRFAISTFLKPCRLSSEVIPLRSRSPPKLLALWGKIPPLCSDGGWISMNLQDLSAI